MRKYTKVLTLKDKEDGKIIIDESYNMNKNGCPNEDHKDFVSEKRLIPLYCDHCKKLIENRIMYIAGLIFFSPTLNLRYVSSSSSFI